MSFIGRRPHITPLTSSIMCAILPDMDRQKELVGTLAALRKGVHSLIAWYNSFLSDMTLNMERPPAAALAAFPCPWPLWETRVDRCEQVHNLFCPS